MSKLSEALKKSAETPEFQEEYLKLQIYDLVMENDQLKKVIQAQKEEWGGDDIDGDRPLSIQDKIDRADPIYTKDYATYEMALKMVGAKHSKYGLVDLVNYLLSVIKKWEARVKELEEQ